MLSSFIKTEKTFILNVLRQKGCLRGKAWKLIMKELKSLFQFEIFTKPFLFPTTVRPFSFESKDIILRLSVEMMGRADRTHYKANINSKRMSENSK